MTGNVLTSAQEERLYLLIEECAEVQHAATKILRHGMASHNPDAIRAPSNRESLERELGDLLLPSTV